jgi:ActR/RegA family two-component response regulator
MSDELLLQNRPRVLIVDNEERLVKLYARLLSIWKYSVVIAEGSGMALLEDAVNKAQQSRCQLALVDMRLIDNFDEDDTSGLELIELLKPAKTITVSGYGTLQLALETVQNRGAVDFFVKSDDPDQLREKLDRIANRTCAACKPMEIGPEDILDSAKKTLFDSTVPVECHDQIRDALVRLFPNAEKLHLEKMNSTTGVSSDFSTVPRPRSVILRVYEDELQPVIVKLARRAKVNKEIERFNKYIRGRLVGQYKPTLESYVELWDIGGIKLSYVGSIEETFANFISQGSIEKIEQSLEHFFVHTWSDHYSRARDVYNESLFKIYCDVWEKDWVKRANEFVMPDPTEAMEAMIWEKSGADRPLDWLRLMQELEGSLNDPSLVQETRIAVTHGDLHADNLLIDDSQHGWVVDFERSGEGHALQDFIELESDIITRLACAQEDFPAFYHFCLTITSGQSIDDLSYAHETLANAETQKLLDTIAAIRRLAVRCTGIQDIRQYLLGLYFNTIFRATIVSREPKKSELRAWMLASILCHRLAHWGDAWPPAGWSDLSFRTEES